MEKRYITYDEAVSLLNEGETIHTFRNSNSLLLGTDRNRAGLLETMRQHESTLQIGGDMCRKMGHGLVLEDKSGFLFIETNGIKLNAFYPL